jgi:hypothetical protein
VKFIPAGFHTVNLPKRGDGALSLIVPTGQKVAGSTDAAGAAFWFNGQDELSLNPAFAGASAFGKTFTYNGSKQVESGLPGEKAKPMTVKFTKPGTYTCPRRRQAARALQEPRHGVQPAAARSSATRRSSTRASATSSSGT